MVDHGMTRRSQPTEREQQSRFGWMSAHHRVLALVGIAVVVLAGLGLGVSLSTVVLLGIVLVCPLMMLGMMFGMKDMHSGHQAGTGSNGALDIVRERYARGELTPDQYERMRQDLS